jgi:hypothetical protein
MKTSQGLRTNKHTKVVSLPDQNSKSKKKLSYVELMLPINNYP